MAVDKKVFVVTSDLGFGLFDRIKQDSPDRFINSGAAELTGMGICVGLALCGFKPIFYSITPFALFRPAEIIRNYVNKEGIPVTIMCSGLDDDYEHDGFSHNASDATALLAIFPNIRTYIPTTKEGAYNTLKATLKENHPTAIILRR
jgi:transketolase